MNEGIFNMLGITTIAGILFIGLAIPVIAEFDVDEVNVNENAPVPDFAISWRIHSETAVKQKVIDDAWAKLSEAKALIEIATSVKEPRYFEPYEYVYVGNFYLTMYAATIEQCGSTSGITASGRKCTEDPTCWTVAVDPKIIPLGTYLIIEGYEGIIFRADDTGGDIKNYWIDIYTDDEGLSKSFNPKYADVWIIKEV